MDKEKVQTREEIRYDLNTLFHKHLNPDFHGEAWGLINYLVDIEQDMIHVSASQNMVEAVRTWLQRFHDDSERTLGPMEFTELEYILRG